MPIPDGPSRRPTARSRHKSTPAVEPAPPPLPPSSTPPPPPRSAPRVPAPDTPPPFLYHQHVEDLQSALGVATPIQTDYGATGPGVFRGPGYFDIDSQLSKKIFIKDRYAFEIGGQFYKSEEH